MRGGEGLSGPLLMSKDTQENKENDLLVDLGDTIPVGLPETPAHLLKRTYSNVLKPSGDKPARSRSTSPMKRTGRLPLASKDHNKSGAWGPLKKRQPILQGDILSNSRKLKKYGSVLGYNELPRTKSLVLKDGEDEDDEEEGEIQKKLRDAMSRREESNEGLSDSGLSKLVREAKDEIEFAPHKVEELKYVPDGVSLLGDGELAKLKTVNLGMWNDEDEDENVNESEDETVDGLLPLKQIKSYGSEREEMEGNTYNDERHRLEPAETQAFNEADLDYRGDGLNAEELEELLS